MNKNTKLAWLLVGVVVTFAVLFALCTPSHGMEVGVSTYQFSANSSENVVQNSVGIEIKVKGDVGYLFGGAETLELKYGGQRGLDLDLFFGGVGIEHVVSEWLRVFCQVGWYEPRSSTHGRWLTVKDSTLAEGLMIQTCQDLCPPLTPVMWDFYSVDHSGNVGGSVGLVLDYPISKRCSLTLSPSYRALKIAQYIKTKMAGPNRGWELRTELDLSGWIIAGGFALRW